MPSSISSIDRAKQLCCFFEVSLNPWGTKFTCGELANQIFPMMQQAGTPNSGVKNLDSCIPATAAEMILAKEVLVIDFGGTNTKAALRSEQVQERKGKLSPLFKASHAELDQANTSLAPESNSFLRYLDNLFAELATNLERKGISPNSLQGLAVVWSNVFTAVNFEYEGCSGVGAIIDCQKNISNKSEPFIEGILQLGQNAADGKIELASFLGAVAEQHGFNFKAITIINDTVGTMLSSPEADAGVVSSTGANSTLVANSTIKNTESGAGIKVPINFLGDAEQEHFQYQDVSIENLCAKMGLQDILVGNAPLLRYTTSWPLVPDIMDLSKELIGPDERCFQIIKTLCNELDDQSAFNIIEAGGWLKNLTRPEQLPPLRALSQAIIERSGRMAGVLAWASVCLQVDADPYSTRLIALDSSMAGNFPGYLEQVQSTLNELTASTVTLKHVKPEDEEISIPATGAVQALDNVMWQQYLLAGTKS